MARVLFKIFGNGLNRGGEVGGNGDLNFVSLHAHRQAASQKGNDCQRGKTHCMRSHRETPFIGEGHPNLSRRIGQREDNRYNKKFIALYFQMAIMAPRRDRFSLLCAG